MKLILVGILILSLGFCAAVSAETSLNGYIKLDERILTEDSGEYSWNRATLALKAKSELSQQVSGYGELKIRTTDFPSVTSPSDLTSKSNVTPVNMELREAYLDVFSFPFPVMDLRAGKQRIAWGTADKLNQTDNLNPYDFSDILEFGKKIPTNAIKLTTYLGDNTLTAAVTPVFTPAVMPSTYNTYLSTSISNKLPSGSTLTSFESSVTLPENKLENSAFGIKLSRNILGYDMSLSYFKGRDSIPNIATFTLTLESLSPTKFSASVSQNYPKIQVIGYDLAGSFKGIGLWAEVAYFKPDNLIQTVAPPQPFVTTTTEVNDYIKYTLGFDYTFNNGFYINSQFMHGFFDERGEDLSDMLLARIEKKLYHEKIKVALSWLGDCDNNKLIGNLFAPQITWYPADATEIEFGTISVHGDSGSNLGIMETMDQAYLKFKYSF